MKRSTKIAVIGLAGLTIVLIGGVFAVFYAVSDLCRNQVLSESRSPDGSKKLVVFERNCGATTGFSTHASILSFAASLTNEAGNSFVADTNHGVAPSGLGGGLELRTSWIAPNQLLIQHHKGARVFIAEERADGIHIRYETFN